MRGDLLPVSLEHLVGLARRVWFSPGPSHRLAGLRLDAQTDFGQSEVDEANIGLTTGAFPPFPVLAESSCRPAARAARAIETISKDATLTPEQKTALIHEAIAATERIYQRMLDRLESQSKNVKETALQMLAVGASLTALIWGVH